ncbi:DUF5719 family protein [Microcella sp.]|uniref:DUF5719 family protein n=1 Tax=Microcella sp. TaxID=1913979 RepID=UPI00299F5E1D|nr:DUF5719 family protein [Microcella sp.]MDX2025777.1 DUF5719 family protein [Microcella sp.]
MTMSNGAEGNRASRSQSWLRAGGRASLAVGAAVAGAALVAGVALVPGPSFGPTVPTVSVTPDRADQSLVCAGGALGLTRGDDPQLAVIEPERRHATGSGLVTSTLASNDVIDGSAVVVTLPREAPGDALAATGIVRPTTPDLAGLAAAECLTPSRTSWLVGGSTTVGRTTWIVLSNSDAVDAVVDLALWGDAGPIDAVGTTGIIVAAGSQRVVSLAGVAVDEPSPVVRVSSTGGSVAATLQTSVVRGLTPSGLSIVTPLAEPAVRHVIAALPVINGQLALESSTADGGADGLPALRMLAPGDAAAQVTVRLVGLDGAAGLVTEATLEPGVVLDLPLTNLADGEYAVIVDATEPIVVAARTSTAGIESADLEWFSPSPALPADTEVLVAVPPLDDDVSALIHLLAPEGAAQVTIDGTVVSIAAGGMVIVPSASNAGVRLSANGTVHASVSYRGEGVLAGSRVLAPPSAVGPLTVLPQ